MKQKEIFVKPFNAIKIIIKSTQQAWFVPRRTDKHLFYNENY